MVLDDGRSLAVALHNSGGMAALGVGIGWWLKIAAAALGGGGGRSSCNDCIGVASSKPRAYYYDISISGSKDGKRGCFQCKGSTPAVMARR